MLGFHFGKEGKEQARKRAGSDIEELLRAATMAFTMRKMEGHDSVFLRITHSNLKNFSIDVHFSLQAISKSPILKKKNLWVFLLLIFMSLRQQWSL